MITKYKNIKTWNISLQKWQNLKCNKEIYEKINQAIENYKKQHESIPYLIYKGNSQ